MFGNRNEDVYIKSNATKLPPVVNHEALAEAHQQYLFCRSMQTISESALQTLTTLLTRVFGCEPINVALGGIQPSKNRSTGSLKQKTLGCYHQSSLNGKPYKWIEVFKFTAKRQQHIAAKTATDTLLHEINHHIDTDKLDIRPSLHTAGFYLRISEMQQLLKNP
jgi:hypothetical protein